MDEEQPTPSDPETEARDPLRGLQTTAADSFETLTETATQLANQARGVYEASQESVRHYPVGYVVGAFALGCFLGVLWGLD